MTHIRLLRAKISARRFIARAGRALRGPELVWPYLRFRANQVSYLLGNHGQSWPPRTILLGVNSVCNQRCAMCDFGQRATDRMFYQNLRPQQKALELPLDRLQALVDEVKPFRPVLEAHTTEPTLYRDLPALAEYATKNGLPFRLFTNGVHLADMADDLVTAGVEQIYVSIDGPPDVHDTIRGLPGAFDRAFSGIARVNLARRRRPGSHLKVRINATISNHNHAHLLDLVKAVEELDPFCIMFMHLNFVTPEMAALHNARFAHICQATPLGVDGCAPAAVDVAVLGDQIRQLRQHHRSWKILIQPDITTESELDIYYHQPQRFLHKKRCFMPWQTALIMPDGGVIVRNRCYHTVFGNIFEQDLMTIWNNQAYRAFRTALKQAGAFPACSRCYGVFS